MVNAAFVAWTEVCHATDAGLALDLVGDLGPIQADNTVKEHPMWQVERIGEHQ